MIGKSGLASDHSTASGGVQLPQVTQWWRSDWRMIWTLHPYPLFSPTDTWLGAHLRAPDIALVLCGAALTYLLAESSRNGSLRWLTSPWLVYLGEISYSTYMIHGVIESGYFPLAAKLGSWALDATPVLLLLPAFILVHLGSVAGYAWIERPGISGSIRSCAARACSRPSRAPMPACTRHRLGHRRRRRGLSKVGVRMVKTPMWMTGCRGGGQD